MEMDGRTGKSGFERLFLEVLEIFGVCGDRNDDDE
jgi:hypothetical protein